MPIFSSTVNDLQSGASYKYNSAGNNDRIKVEDDVVNRNIFDRGGSIECWVYGDPADGIIPSRIILKDGTAAVGFDLGGYGNTTGVFYFDFLQHFNTTIGRWNTPETITLYEWHHLVVTYDNSSVSNDPILYVDGVSQTVTESSTPVGTRVSDENYDIYIGNRQTLARSLCGEISSVRMHNRILTADEVVDSYNGQMVPYEYRSKNKGWGNNLIVPSWTSSTDGWTAWSTGSSVSASGGTLSVTASSNTVSTATYIDSTSTFSASYNKWWRLTMTVSNGDSSALYSIASQSTWNPAGFSMGTGNGTHSIEWFSTAENQMSAIGITTSVASDTFDITNLSIDHVCCVAEFLPSGISADRWVDTSGNDLHGTVSGAIANNHKRGSLTLENLHTTAMTFTGTADSGATLDSYEEGTFTPAVFYQDATNQAAATHVHQHGTYTRIGRQVFVTYDIKWTLASGAINNNMGVKNLPFTKATDLPGTQVFYGRSLVHINMSSAVEYILQLEYTYVIFTDGHAGNLGDEVGNGTHQSKGTISYIVNS